MPPGNHRNRKQVAAIQRAAIRRQSIDLILAVGTPDVSPTARPRSADVDPNDISVVRRPLALNPENLRAEVERQVVALVLGQRL